MRVDPDEADLLSLAAIELRDAGDRAGGDGVVAAENDGRRALFERLHDEVRGLDAGLANFLQVLRVLIARLFGFGDGDADVAAIGDHVAERFKMRFEAGDAHGRGPHVHTAPRLAPGRAARR